MLDTGTMLESGASSKDADDWLGVVEAAATELTPVALELSAPRRVVCSYLVDVVGVGGNARAVLAPVPSDAVPEGVPVRVTPAQGRSWGLHAPALHHDVRGGASIALDRARFSHGAGVDERGLSTGHGLVVLVVPGGLGAESSYVFPVRRVGQDCCEIETTMATEPGTTLESVELMGDRRVLRHASAQVVSVQPMVRADGARLFRCELSLGPVRAPSAARDLVTDPAEVRRLLDFAGMMRVSGWYEAPGWGRGALVFERVERDHAIVRLEGGHGDAPPQLSVRIGVELFAASYEFEVRVLRMAGAKAHTTLPLIMRRRRSHRREQLVAVPEDEVVVLTFVNPISGRTQRRSVAALSFFSLRFASELEDAMLWPGAPLERAQLEWRGRLVLLGDLEVADAREDGAADTTLVLASSSRLTDDVDLVALIAVCSHPEVRVHDGDDFSSLHEAYVQAGLFAPHMHRNLAPIVEDAAEVWRRMHVDASDVVRTLVHHTGGVLDGAVTVMRAWESAWVAQHFVDVGSSINNATGKLQTAYLDHLLPRPDGRYLVFFIKSDNHVMLAYMRRFFASVGTDDAASQRTVELWVTSGDAATGDVDVSRPVAASERRMIQHACERAYGAHATAALSMLAPELELPDTRARFARAGLDRARECRVVEHAGRVAYAMLEERSTPGINLTWMLNATWLVPVHAPDDPGALDAALRSVRARPCQAPTGERFLNLPPGLDAARLSRAGFERLASVEMFVLNRAGVHQFFQYASRRYGELDARRALRQRRRSGSEPAGGEHE